MSNYQISLVMLACISVITVSGVFTMTSLAGMFSLGQAAYMSICAYLTFCLARYLSLPIWITAVIGLAASGLIALIISLPTLKLRRIPTVCPWSLRWKKTSGLTASRRLRAME